MSSCGSEQGFLASVILTLLCVAALCIIGYLATSLDATISSALWQPKKSLDISKIPWGDKSLLVKNYWFRMFCSVLTKKERHTLFCIDSIMLSVNLMKFDEWVTRCWNVRILDVGKRWIISRKFIGLSCPRFFSHLAKFDQKCRVQGLGYTSLFAHLI